MNLITAETKKHGKMPNRVIVGINIWADGFITVKGQTGELLGQFENLDQLIEYLNTDYPEPKEGPQPEKKKK